MQKVYITKLLLALTGAGNLDTLDSPGHQVGENHVGAYYRRNNVQIQLQIFLVSLACYTHKKILVNKGCAVYTEEYGTLCFLLFLYKY